jgi:DNA-binding response OmpR family regulator
MTGSAGAEPEGLIMTRILLADDDTELCEMLHDYLTAEGFSVAVTHDGESALALARSGAYDLVVLDLMMPGLSGFDVLRALRPQCTTPVLMLTARDEDVDSIVGLELGADDYLGKPCNPRVLVARIRALLRRAEPPREEGAPAHLRLADLELHGGSRTVLCCGLPVPMTSTELRVLEVLLREAGRVVSKADLSEQALGRKLGRYDRSLDMHVSSLRRKLGPLPDGQERIKTVRGVGYQYTTP